MIGNKYRITLSGKGVFPYSAFSRCRWNPHSEGDWRVMGESSTELRTVRVNSFDLPNLKEPSITSWTVSVFEPSSNRSVDDYEAYHTWPC